MSADELILDRIKKLLRLSRSSNPHEAALALHRAMELAQAHSIRLASIDPDDEVGGIRHKERDEARITFDKRLAMMLVQRYFSVKIIRGWNNLKIIGRAPDIQIAEYAYIFIVRSCRNCLAAYTKSERAERRKDTPNKRRQFVNGFMGGIDYQLREFRMRNQTSSGEGTSLVATAALENRRREAYALERWRLGKMPPPDYGRANAGAISNGFHQGRNTSIHQPIPGADLHHPRQLKP